MAKFDRSKFKTSKSLAKQEEELADKIKTNSYGSNPDLIEIKEDGDYLIRFWPTPVEDSYFMLPTMVHFMDMELDKYEEGEIVTNPDGTAVREVRKATVFNSRIHGNTEKDIVEEYIKMVEEMADEKFGKDTKSKKIFLKHIKGHGHGKDYVGGITGQLDYVAYASLLKKQGDKYVEEKFGRIKLKPSIRTQMLKLAAGGDDPNSDPFSDPDEGFIVKVVRDSVAGKKDPGNYYVTSWEQKNYVPVKWPLPEGFENKFDEMQTLPEIYEDKYNPRDFANALDGLTRFDKAHEYGIFSYDSFMDTCEEIAEYYPEEDDQESTGIEDRRPAASNAGGMNKKDLSPTTKAPEPKEEAPTPVKEEPAAKGEVAVESEEIPFEETSKESISTVDRVQQMKDKIAGRS